MGKNSVIPCISARAMGMYWIQYETCGVIRGKQFKDTIDQVLIG